MLTLLVACAQDPAGTRTPEDTGSSTSTSPTSTEPTVTDAGNQLAALDLGVPLTPAFDPERTWYAVRALDLPATFNVVATPEDPAASVDVRLDTVDGLPVASGTTLSALGDHHVVVEVTGSDGASRSYVVGLLPDDLPEITVARTGPTSGRWYLVANFDFTPDTVLHNFLMVIDDAGVPAWWRRDEMPSFDFRTTDDGRLSWMGLVGAELLGQVAGVGYSIERQVDPVQVPGFDAIVGDPHELTVLADGTVLMICGAVRVEDLSPWGGPSAALVIHQMVQELDPNGDLVSWWSDADNVDYDTLPAGLVAYMNDPAVQYAGWEPSHVNSVAIDPVDGNWVISMRLASTVVKVARTAGTFDGRTVGAGNVVWRLGGPQSDFTFVDDGRENGWTGFSEQHHARMTGPDTLTLFDNSTSIDVGFTGTARMVEYQLDTTTWTATRLTDYALPDSGPSPAGGNVQRLPDGHTLVGWGQLQEAGGAKAPAMTELDENGQPVLSLFLESAQWSYRIFAAEGDPLANTWGLTEDL